MKTENLRSINLESLNDSELKNIDGGVAPIVVGLAVVGTAAGVVLVGAAIGYGVYKLVSWAAS